MKNRLFAPIAGVSVALCLLQDSLSGSGDDLRPWELLSGEASMSDLEFVSGESSIRLHGGVPPVELARFLADEEVNGQEDLLVRFWFLPVADASEAPMSSVNVLGAQLGFVLEEGRGRIYVFDHEEALPTDFYFDILSSGEAAYWLQLGIEHEHLFDEEKAAWRLFLGEEEFDRPLKPMPLPPEAPFVQFFGDDRWDVFLDGFVVSMIDGDADDADSRSDRKNDSEEKNELHRKPSGATSTSETSGTGGDDADGDDLMMAAADPDPVVYVDGDNGDDTATGSSPNEALETIGTGMALVADNGLVIVKEASVAYVEARVSPQGKTVRIRPDGVVRLR